MCQIGYILAQQRVGGQCRAATQDSGDLFALRRRLHAVDRTRASLLGDHEAPGGAMVGMDLSVSRKGLPSSLADDRDRGFGDIRPDRR